MLVSNFGKIESAQPGDLAFLANPKYESFAYTTKASILLVASDFTPKQPVSSTLIRVDDPYAALAQLMQLVEQQSAPRLQGISEKADIAADVAGLDASAALIDQLAHVSDLFIAELVEWLL